MSFLKGRLYEDHLEYLIVEHIINKANKVDAKLLIPPFETNPSISSLPPIWKEDIHPPILSNFKGSIFISPLIEWETIPSFNKEEFTLW